MGLISLYIETVSNHTKLNILHLSSIELIFPNTFPTETIMF